MDKPKTVTDDLKEIFLKGPDSVIQKRISVLEEARKKSLEDKGMKQFYTLPVGDTHVVVDINTAPRLTPNGKNAYRIKLGKDEYDLPLTASTELKMLHLIKKNGSTKLIFTRVGTERTDTRYSVRSE